MAWSLCIKALNISKIPFELPSVFTGLSGTQNTQTDSDITNTTAIIKAHHLKPALYPEPVPNAPRIGTTVIVSTVGIASPMPAHVLAMDVSCSRSFPGSVIAGIIDQNGISMRVYVMPQAK